MAMNQPVFRGFDQEELDEALGKVVPADDWRGQIDATCWECDREVTDAAIRFFTATAPRFEVVPGKGHPALGQKLRVQAPGYRLGPAGPCAPTSRRPADGTAGTPPGAPTGRPSPRDVGAKCGIHLRPATQPDHGMQFVIQYFDQINGHWETLPRLYRTRQEASRATDDFGVIITERYDETRIIPARTGRRSRTA